MDYEEDLLSFLGEVTFFSRLKIRGVIIHSRSYNRGPRRNNLWFIRRETALFMGKLKCSLLPRMFQECVVSVTVVSSHVSEKHDFFGSTVTHVACLSSQTKQDQIYYCPSWKHHWCVYLYEVFRLWFWLCCSFCKSYIERDWIMYIVSILPTSIVGSYYWDRFYPLSVLQFIIIVLELYHRPEDFPEKHTIKLILLL